MCMLLLYITISIVGNNQISYLAIDRLSDQIYRAPPRRAVLSYSTGIYGERLRWFCRIPFCAIFHFVSVIIYCVILFKIQSNCASFLTIPFVQFPFLILFHFFSFFLFCCYFCIKIMVVLYK
jgi:hypothetical protein